MKKKKVLITGGLGFIFSHLTEYFVAKGYDVTVIDNYSIGSHPEIVDGSFKLIKADFSAVDAWKLAVAEKPEWFIHAAAMTDVDHSLKDPQAVMLNNTHCNLNAYEAARRIESLEKFLYVGTDEVYGECEYPKKETDILFPRNPYAASKAMGSLMRYAYDNYLSIKDKTAEIRMCNIFGPRQDDRKIMPLIVKSLKSGVSIPLQNKGVGYREYLYVKNVPPMIERVMLRGDRTYNVTNNDGLTVVELIAIIEKLTGKKVKTHESDRQIHDRFYRMDNSRLVKEIGWNPEYTFKAGLKEYLKKEGVL